MDLATLLDGLSALGAVLSAGLMLYGAWLCLYGAWLRLPLHDPRLMKEGAHENEGEPVFRQPRSRPDGYGQARTMRFGSWFQRLLGMSSQLRLVRRRSEPNVE